MKKLFFTVTTDLNHDQRMIRICSSLAQNGYEVTLIGRKLPTSQPLQTQVFTQKRLSCFFHKGKLFYAEYNFRLFFYLWIKKFDLVCAIDLDTILPCFLTSKIKKTVIVYDAHEYFTEVPEVINRPLTKKIWGKIAHFCIPRIPNCYTVGEGLANLFSKRYNIDFQVIRNISRTKSNYLSNVFDEKKSSNLPIILYQGALNEGRCLEYYIEAMQYIDDAVLHLAGDGDLTDELKALVLRFKVEKKVKFLGKLTPSELDAVTRKAYLGLNLLENKGLSYYYSLANKTFDYLQANIPALHPDFPEYQAIISQYEIGYLIKNLSVEEIVAALQRLLQDKNEYERLQKECKKAQPVFTWENEEKKLLAFYEKIFPIF
jgi:glycosyltransferase involved in cell wall biosynthesis